MLPDNQPDSALHVVTKTEETASSLLGHDNSTEKLPNTMDKCSLEQDLHVETGVTCPEDGILLSQFPWKQQLAVKIDQIHLVEIDIWSKKVRDYYVYTILKCVTPIISDIKGYGLQKRPIKEEPPSDEQSQKTPTDDNTDQLIDHAKALIDTAKTFITKPVGHKHGRKHPATSPVETDVKPKALDVLHGETMNKLTTLQVETDGSSRPSDADSNTQKHRKIRCKMCNEIFSSVKELNTHHKNDHGIVNCNKFSKYFSTQSSLDKHSYTHGDLKFNCELCGKCFPFESRLDQNMLVHINNKLSCPKKSCDKQFKGIGDLNRHIKPTPKAVGIIVINVTIKTKTNTTLTLNMRTHSKEHEGRYECDKWG